MNLDSNETPMTEGEEPPPPGLKLMATVRWILLGLAAILAVSAWWSFARAELDSGAGREQATAQYHCPMHPQITSNEPGECPICHMNLERIVSHRAEAAQTSSAPLAPTPRPKRATPGNASASPSKSSNDNVPAAPSGTVPPGTAPITLTLDRIQAIGVRTAVVTAQSLDPKLRVTALVAPTEQGVVEVHVRTAGFVERLHVNQIGSSVGKQQPLFAFYSPEILQAESELLSSRRWSGEGGRTTGDASRRKLELLGMSPNDIDAVLKSNEPMREIPIYAPQSGYVTKKNITAGSYVTPEMVLYEIQDLSKVYIIADVFQQDIGSLPRGTVGRFTPARRMDQTIDVRIDLIDPTLNSEARTTRVRSVVLNPKGSMLRPGEYGTIEFATAPRQGVVVPRDAVIDTGLSTYAFVVEGEGRFTPRHVTLGQEQGEFVTIASGLSAGERVVSGATFLIDSESRLQASAVEATATAPPSGPSPSKPADGPSCESDFDRSKHLDKWIECQKCAQIHHGMGSMEADCKNTIPKPWK